MKSEKLMCTAAIGSLVALAITVSLAAQEHHTEHHKYKFVDLGTFGGPASYDNAGLIAINSQGRAIGGAETSVVQPPNNLKAVTIIQHEERDVAKLPKFPQFAE